MTASKQPIAWSRRRAPVRCRKSTADTEAGKKPALSAAQGVLAKLYLQSGKYQEAAEECRKALAINPQDQASLYHLIQALRKTGNTSDIPELLKRLALLRKQSAREQSQRYQYKLVEEDASPN